MQVAHPGSQQILTVFGGGYVAEQHADEAHRNLSTTERRGAGIALLWLVFYVVIGLAALAHNTGPIM